MRKATLLINPAIMYSARPLCNTVGYSIITITNHLELYKKRFQFITTKVTENLFLVIKSNEMKSLKNQLSTFFYK